VSISPALQKLRAFREFVHSAEGPIFAQVKIDPEALPFVLPPAEGGILKNRFRASVLGEEALHN
jgi:hypothetical protein